MSVLRTVVIDSDPESRAALRRMLATSGAAAVVGEFADLGDAAVSEAEARRPDVLVVELGGAVPSAESAALATLERLVETFREAAVFITGPPVPGDFLMRLIRTGAFEYLPRPIQREDLVAAIDKVLRVRRSVGPGRRAGRITAVFSPTGGLGVTTVATNVAVALARRAPDATLLVDFDTRQSDVATFLGLRPTYCVLDAFENIERLDELYLRGLLVKHTSGLWVLPGPLRMERFALGGEQVRAGLEIIRSHFDDVVVDLRHDLDPGTAAALEAADNVLLLTALTVPALRAGAGALAAFRHLGLNLPKVRVVAMREETAQDVSLKHAREVLGVAVTHRVPNDYGTVMGAINAGQPVVITAPRAKVSRTFQELAAGLAAPAGEREQAPRGAMGRLRMFLAPKKLAKAS